MLQVGALRKMVWVAEIVFMREGQSKNAFDEINHSSLRSRHSALTSVHLESPALEFGAEIHEKFVPH
jgi:hypothetical protein